MKKLLYFAFFSFFAFFTGAIADTITINWLNTDNTINQTTTCNIGGDLILPATPTKPGYDFVGWAANYTPIEYLESTGTQYIDTGYQLNSSHVKIHVKFKKKTNDVGSVIGSSSTTNDSNWYVLFCNSRSCYWAIGNDGGKAQYSYSLDTIYDIEFETFVDGTFVSQTNNNPSTGTWGGNFLGMGNVYLYTMSYNYASYNWLTSDLVIYFAKIYDNDVLVRDFIPVIDYNGVPCMYDKVTNQFFYNAGTGDFIAGPVVGGGS